MSLLPFEEQRASIGRSANNILETVELLTGGLRDLTAATAKLAEDALAISQSEISAELEAAKKKQLSAKRAATRANKA